MIEKLTIKDKRILIINSDSLTSQNATGITMRSIFSNWDINSLFEISCAPSSAESMYRGRKLNALPYKYYPVYYLLNLKLFKKANTASKEKHNQESIKNSKNYFSFIRSVIIAYADSLPLLSPRKLLKEVEKFKPDYIYTMGGSILSLKLALYFSKKMNKKIVIHFMDNWQDTLYSNSFFLWPCRRVLVNVLNKAYCQIDKALTISEKMADEYSKRWNKEHIAIMNIINDSLNIPKLFNNKNKIIIAYAGGLHLERWKSLLVISNIIEKVNDLNRREVYLEIYTSDSNRRLYENLFNNKYTVFKSSVPHNDIKSIYKTVDILLHMESFNPTIKAFTKYSMSTKISEYMASGKPILLYAPSELALSEYVTKNNCGIACSNQTELIDAVARLIDSAELRHEYGLSGIACVKKHHTYEEAFKKINYVFND